MILAVDHIEEDRYEVNIGGVKHTLSEAEVGKLNHLTKLKRNYTRLAYKEWNKLDDLLGMHGWGGYYDLVECMKGDLSALGAAYCTKPGGMLDIAESVNTLPEAMDLLFAWAKLVGNWRMAQLKDNKDWGEEVRQHWKAS